MNNRRVVTCYKDFSTGSYSWSQNINNFSDFNPKLVKICNIAYSPVSGDPVGKIFLIQSTLTGGFDYIGVFSSNVFQPVNPEIIINNPCNVYNIGFNVLAMDSNSNLIPPVVGPAGQIAIIMEFFE